MGQGDEQEFIDLKDENGHTIITNVVNDKNYEAFDILAEELKFLPEIINYPLLTAQATWEEESEAKLKAFVEDNKEKKI